MTKGGADGFDDFIQCMKPSIRYIEYPARRSGMRNSQHSRLTYIFIINQCPSIESVSDRDSRFHRNGRIWNLQSFYENIKSLS